MTLVVDQHGGDGKADAMQTRHDPSNIWLNMLPTYALQSL